MGLAGTPTCGTGFSRERASGHIAKVEVPALASSRLKPVPLNHRVHSMGLAGTPTCGTGFSRECVGGYTAKVTGPALAPSRLKPGPLNHPRAFNGTGWNADLWDRLQPGTRQ